MALYPKLIVPLQIDRVTPAMDPRLNSAHEGDATGAANGHGVWASVDIHSLSTSGHCALSVPQPSLVRDQAGLQHLCQDHPSLSPHRHAPDSCAPASRSGR